MIAAIIPARGGSKRIPRKNIRDFCGQPMIAQSIARARESGVFDRIIVSTDDEDIAEVARTHGAETPFMRPASLADDYATSGEVVAHAARWLEDAGCAPSVLCCIYATAPFLDAQDLRSSLALLHAQNARFVFSATSFDFPIQRALRRTDNGGVAMLHPEHETTRSQDLEEYYHDAGMFYWGRAEAWINNAPIFAPHSRAFLLPHYRVHDIDTPSDWTRAELMFTALRALHETSH